MFREKLTGYFTKKIEIKNSPGKGLGVFALEDIPEHYCIERSHAIIFTKATMAHLWYLRKNQHVLHDYVFKWNSNNCCIVLGMGSIYNHSSYANVSYRPVLEENNKAYEFWTKRKIKKGEELFIRYHSSEMIEKGIYSEVEDELLHEHFGLISND